MSRNLSQLPYQECHSKLERIDSTPERRGQPREKRSGNVSKNIQYIPDQEWPSD
jgi:hypothetical protein